MSSHVRPQREQLEAVLEAIPRSPGIQLRCWSEADFPAIQRLSALEDWSTPDSRPEESLIAWQHSWPTLVVLSFENVIGFVRGLTDGEITTYIAELLVDPRYRGKGLGRLLLEACHALHPHTRLDLISTEEALPFYKRNGFRGVGAGVRKSYR